MEDVRYSIMNQQDSTFKFFFFFSSSFSLQSWGEVASGRKCLYCVLFCLSAAIVSASDSVHSQAYITLFRFHCLIVSLFSLAEETSPLGRELESECSHFEE